MARRARRHDAWLEQLRAYAARAFRRRPLWRPEDDLVPDEPEAGRRWLELPRARALYALVCASPADDEPRRVLGDHLLEHGRSWLSPLGAVIPRSGAGWARGFLARADVHVHSARAVPAEAR